MPENLFSRDFFLAAELREMDEDRVPKEESDVSRKPRSVAKTAQVEVSEAGRRASARLRLVLGSEAHIIVVTGVGGSYGSSMFAAELALALAELERTRVLLVGGSTAEPLANQRFDLPTSPGFCDVIEGRMELSDAVCPSDRDNFFVLPAGQAQVAQTALFASHKCRELMAGLRGQYSYVIVDAGPVLETAESLLLASLGDGVLAVVVAGEARGPEVVRLKEELAAIHAKLLGVVLVERG